MNSVVNHINNNNNSNELVLNNNNDDVLNFNICLPPNVSIISGCSICYIDDTTEKIYCTNCTNSVHPKCLKKCVSNRKQQSCCIPCIVCKNGILCYGEHKKNLVSTKFDVEYKEKEKSTLIFCANRENLLSLLIKSPKNTFKDKFCLVICLLSSFTIIASLCFYLAYLLIIMIDENKNKK